MDEIILITGPARSGKSRLAERLAAARGPEVLYIATMVAIDEETRDRIAEHRRVRPASWTTTEAPRDIVAALAGGAEYDSYLLDCLTLWVSNELLEAHERKVSWPETRRAVLGKAGSLIETSRRRRLSLILVSNEAGSGVVPEYELGRQFRDLLGEVNQLIAREADSLYTTVAGHFLELKGLGARAVDDA